MRRNEASIPTLVLPYHAHSTDVDRPIWIGQIFLPDTVQLKTVLFVAAIIVAVAASPISTGIPSKKYMPLVSPELHVLVDLVRELTIFDSVFLIKQEMFRGVLGRLLHGIGQIPVRRGEPDRTPLLAAVRVLRAGGLVGVFPEGTRGAGDVDVERDLRPRSQSSSPRKRGPSRTRRLGSRFRGNDEFE